MTVAVVNNWNTLGVTGRVDVAELTVAGSTVVANAASSAAPATATSTGVAGTIAYDATHIYVCVATNTWVRANLATW